MTRSYPSQPGDRPGHPLLVLLTLLAVGALAVACLWCANHPRSAWTHAVTAVLVVLGILVVGLMALAPVAARQAGGRR